MNDRAYHLEPLHDLAGLTVAPQQLPQPGPHEVVIRVRAASLNRRDLMLLEGTYPLPARSGVVPLADGVGEVIAVGDGVTRAAVGDRLTATYFRGWIDGPQRIEWVREQYGANHDGMLATYAVLAENTVVHVPAHLTDAEAATLSCAGVVAWAALTKPLPVRPGETVLTVGTGTAALFGVQFAHGLGTRVISVTSSPDKAERLRKLGASEVLDRGVTPDWEQAVLELTDGAGVEHVLDFVGMPTLPKSVAAAAYNAQITLVGAFPARPEQAGMDPFGGKYLAIRRIAVGSRTDFEAMNRHIDEHRLRPVIDRAFGFDDAVEAYRYLRDGNPFGKVVVTP